MAAVQRVCAVLRAAIPVVQTLTVLVERAAMGHVLRRAVLRPMIPALQAVNVVPVTAQQMSFLVSVRKHAAFLLEVRIATFQIWAMPVVVILKRASFVEMRAARFRRRHAMEWKTAAEASTLCARKINVAFQLGV